MTTNNRNTSTTSSDAKAQASAWRMSPRVLGLWIGIVAVAGVATFGWHAAGQGTSDAPNTRRFLEQYAAAKDRAQGTPAVPFESIGGIPVANGPATQNAPANNPQVQTPPQQQQAPGFAAGQYPRVADRQFGPQTQVAHSQVPQSNGPAFGSAGAPPYEQSILANNVQDQNNSVNALPSPNVQFAPPEIPSGDPLRDYPNVPAPVGGFGQAGQAAPQGQPNLTMPTQPQFSTETIPGPGGALPTPAASGQGTYSRQPVPQQHFGGHHSYAPFANAGTGPTTPYGQGAYVNPGRTPHVRDYRLRVDDVLDCVFRITREETSKPYELNVGDTIRVESLSEPKINRELIIQPDGTVSLLLLGQVRATRQTVEQFRRRLEELYREFYRQPDITITPLQVNTKLLDVINTVDSRAGTGGQVREAIVAPDGTISLPAVGKIPVQGMNLDEAKREIDARYSVEVQGVEVTPILVRRAQRFIYVVGEARTPGRYELVSPTNVMQAIGLAGGWNVGANLRQVIILRRDPDWRVQATVLDVWDALYGNRTCPIDDIWLADSDVLIIPKMKILVTDDFIELIFTRGIYGVFPFQGASVNFSKLGTL